MIKAQLMVLINQNKSNHPQKLRCLDILERHMASTGKSDIHIILAPVNQCQFSPIEI
jgi:hypothetical protein